MFLTMAPYREQLNPTSHTEYREATNSLATYELDLTEQGLGVFTNEDSGDEHFEGEHLHTDVPCSFALSV